VLPMPRWRGRDVIRYGGALLWPPCRPNRGSSREGRRQGQVVGTKRSIYRYLDFSQWQVAMRR